MNRLLRVELLGVFDTESEEITELRGRVNLRLPRILSLSMHRESHHVVPVFGRNQISRLQENARALGERSGGP